MHNDLSPRYCRFVTERIIIINGHLAHCTLQRTCFQSVVLLPLNVCLHKTYALMVLIVVEFEVKITQYIKVVLVFLGTILRVPYPHNEHRFLLPPQLSLFQTVRRAGRSHSVIAHVHELCLTCAQRLHQTH